MTSLEVIKTKPYEPYIDSLKAFIANVKSKEPYEDDSDAFVDLLPWMRGVSNDNAINVAYDYIYGNEDLQPSAFQNKINYLSVQYTNESELLLKTHNKRLKGQGYKFFPDADPDFVCFSIAFKNEWRQGVDLDTEVETLFLYLLIILQSDCTGCCNALDYITLTETGIYAQGYVGHTYHS